MSGRGRTGASAAGGGGGITLQQAANAAPVQRVAGRSGEITLAPADLSGFDAGANAAEDARASTAVPALVATDDGPLIATLVTAGARLLPAKNYYVNSVQSITGVTGARLKVADGGSITFGPNGKLQFVNCTSPKYVSTAHVGGLTTPVQYSNAAIDFAAAFASMTFDDGTSSIDGSDFTHTLASGVLTVSALALAGEVTRNCSSSYITLDPAKRYVITATRDYCSGDSGNAPQFILFDGGNAPLAEQLGRNAPNGIHYPGDTLTWFSVISGAAKMKIKLGVTLKTRTARSLTAAFDTSAFTLFELVNDSASITLNPAVVITDDSYILFSNCTNVVCNANAFTRGIKTWVQLVNCKGAGILNNEVTYSFESFQDNGGTNNRIARNRIDQRLQDAAGNLHNCKHLRRHGVSGGNCDNLQITRNEIDGASWGVEVLTYSTARVCSVSNNDVSAEFLGISLHAGKGNRACGNDIRIGYLGGVGIELVSSASGVDRNVNAVASRNTITGPLRADFVGVTAGRTDSATISFNTITAGVGVYIPNDSNAYSTGRINVVSNDLVYAQCAVYAASPAISVRGNSAVRQGIYSGNGNIEGALIFISPPTETAALIEVSGNVGDGGSALGIGVFKASNVRMIGNDLTEGLTKQRSIFIGYSAAAMKAVLIGNSVSDAAGAYYEQLAFTGSPPAGTNIYCEGNAVNGAAFNQPDGALGGGNVTLRSASKMIGAIVWNVGSLAAGASETSPDIGVSGATLSDFPRWACSTSTQGMTVTAYMHSAGVVRIVCFNSTGSTLDLPTATWTVAVDKP